jgi:hypothetical protein
MLQGQQFNNETIQQSILHMRYFVGHGVKRRVAIDLVTGWFEEWVGVVGVGSGDVLGLDYPNAHAFVPAGVEVTGVFDCHFRISGVQATDMLVVEAAFAADEYFPEGPFLFHRIDCLIVINV